MNNTTILEYIDAISGIKSDIASAIINKGQDLTNIPFSRLC